MTPEELLNTLINQSKHKIAGRDLKIIDNPDGTKGILFGNEGMQKSFTLYPKEKISVSKISLLKIIQKKFTMTIIQAQVVL